MIRRFTRNPTAVFLALVILHGALVARAGVRVDNDTTAYTRWADSLIAHGFNYSPAMAGSNPVLRLFRVAFVYYFAAIRIVGASHWAVLFIGLNVLWDALAGTILVRTILEGGGSPLAAVAAFAGYAVCFESAIWTAYVLSDTLYLACSVAVFSCMCRVALRANRRTRDIAALIGSVLVSMTVRPTGVLFIPLAIFAILIGRRALGQPQFRGSLRVPAIAAATAVILLFIATAWIVQRPQRWPSRLLFPVVEAYSHEFSRGEVIHDRPETYHASPQSLADYVFIVVDRFVRFFQFASSTFSVKHNLANAVYFGPLYLFAAIGAVLGIRRSSDVRMLTLLAIVWIAAHAVFHSMTQLDFDWRYRLPAMPQMIVLAAVGVESAWIALRKKEPLTIATAAEAP